MRRAPTDTTVVAIDPSADELPLNALRLYVRFSGPMSEGFAATCVRIRRADGDEPLEGALLAMEPELWDPARRRLTLLLDPGRIKRGLVPHLEAGYPLEPGSDIVIEVDAGFRDAAGRQLGAGASRRYAVGPAVRERVDPAAWRVLAPLSGSTDPLALQFDRPLDRALLEHALVVVDPAGLELDGEPAIGAAQRSWSLTPVHPWTPGRHRLLIAARLEDLAGNSLRRVFDRDLTAPADEPLAITTAMLEFVPRTGCHP